MGNTPKVLNLPNSANAGLWLILFNDASGKHWVLCRVKGKQSQSLDIYWQQLQEGREKMIHNQELVVMNTQQNAEMFMIFLNQIQCRPLDIYGEELAGDWKTQCIKLDESSWLKENYIKPSFN